MKLKTLLLTSAFVASSVAFADAPAPYSNKSKTSMLEDYYTKIELGGTKANKIKGSNDGTNISRKSKTGFIAGIGGGYVFNEFFRTDLMLQFKKNKAKDVKVDTYDAMLNGYLTAHNDTIFTPYLTAGFGIGRNSTKESTYSKKIKKTNFIWNIGLGCQAKIADQASVDLGYRYVDLGKLGKKDGLKLKSLKAHEIAVGLVYHM